MDFAAFGFASESNGVVPVGPVPTRDGERKATDCQSDEHRHHVRHADPFLNFFEGQVAEFRKRVISEHKKVQHKQEVQTKVLQDSVRHLKRHLTKSKEPTPSDYKDSEGGKAPSDDDGGSKSIRRPDNFSKEPSRWGSNLGMSLGFAAVRQPEAPAWAPAKIMPEPPAIPAVDPRASGHFHLECMDNLSALEQQVSGATSQYKSEEQDEVSQRLSVSEGEGTSISREPKARETTHGSKHFSKDVVCFASAGLPGALDIAKNSKSEAASEAPTPRFESDAGSRQRQDSKSECSSDSDSDSDSDDDEAAVDAVADLHGDGAARIRGRKTSTSVPYHVRECWTQAEHDAEMAARSSGTSTATFLRKASRSSFDSEEGQADKNKFDTFFERFVIQPSSRWHLGWEVLGLVFVARDLIMIPLQILDPLHSPVNVALTWLARLCWTVDLVVNFFTGYVSSQGTVETQPSKIARMYSRTRLPVDLTIVACDWMELAFGSTSTFNIIGMLRAMRLVRLQRLMKNQKRIFELLIRSEFIMLVASVTAYLLLLLALIHVIACIWYGIQISQLAPGEAAEGERAALGGGLARRYFFSLHVVLALFLSEHVVMPGTLLETVFTVIVMFLAFVISSAFVGSLTTALTRLQIIASQRSAQFAALSNYLADYKIPDDLALRVKRNARHALDEQKRNTPEGSVALLKLISDQLRAEIHYEIYTKEIIPHPFFKAFNEANPICVRSICHHCISMLSLSRGDAVFAESEVPSKPQMFFVSSGKLAYEQSAVVYFDTTPHTVMPRHWLAEALLWTSWAHRGTARALIECRLLAIDTHLLSQQINMYRTPQRYPYRYAAKYVEFLNSLEDYELTDLANGTLEELMSRSIFVSDTPGGRSSLISSIGLGSGVGNPNVTKRTGSMVVGAMRRASLHLPGNG